MPAPPSDSDRALAGKLVAVPESRQLDVLASLLERRGATVLRCPLVGIHDSPHEAAVLAWIRRLTELPTDLVVLYTGEGVDRLAGFAQRAGLDDALRAALARTPKLTRGPKPKRALRALGVAAEYTAAEPTTAGLVATARTIPTPHGRVAIQLYSEEQDRELVEYFEQRGVAVDCIAPYVYASAAEDDRAADLIGELAAGRVDAIAFTSKSQVERLLKLAKAKGLEAQLRAGLERTLVAVVGPIVAAELAARGIRVDTMPADSYSMKPLVTSICELVVRAP